MSGWQKASGRWFHPFTPLVVCALVLAAGARAESPPAESVLAGGVRRLTEQQYRHAIADIFGEDIQIPGLSAPVGRSQEPQSTGASRLTLFPVRFEQYDWMAQGIAAQVVDQDHRGALVTCVPRNVNLPDDECAAAFFRRTARLLFRRPLSPSDLDAQITTANGATSLAKNFYEGLASSLASMLESPKFLLDVDVLERDPAKAGGRRLDAYSKASRLSLFLWNTTPDAALLDAAAHGDLHTRAGLAKQVARLLASPRLAVSELTSRFERQGESLRALLRETVTSEAFFNVSPGLSPPAREGTR